jgi:sec-independent protein translocase protein TatA
MTSQIAMIFGLGTTELILILLVVLLLFGAKKIPDLARGLGSGIREFKDASREIKREIDTDRTEVKTSTPRQNTEA